MLRRLRNEVEHFANYEDRDDDEERSSYYGGTAVPFIWESRPGTPKHNLYSDTSLPLQLTPPPSYYSEILSTPKKQSKVRAKLTRIFSLSLFSDLRKSSCKKATKNVSGSSFSWSSTSSLSSLSSSPPCSSRKPVNREKKAPILYANHREKEELRLSPTSTLSYSNDGRKSFGSSMKSVRKALFAVPRHGSTDKARTPIYRA